MSRSRVRVPLPAPEFAVEIDVICFDRFFMRFFWDFQNESKMVDALKRFSGLERGTAIKIKTNQKFKVNPER